MANDHPSLPQSIALLPLLDVVIYPHTVTPLALSQPASIRLLDDATAAQLPIILTALRDPYTRPEHIRLEDCHPIGTLAYVHRLLRLPDQTLRVAVEGLERVRIDALDQEEPYLCVRAERVPDTPDGTPETYAMGQTLAALAASVLDLMPAPSHEVLDEIVQVDDPQQLSFLLAARLLQRSSLAERQQLLEVAETRTRIDLLSQLLRREYLVLERVRQVPGADLPPPASETLTPASLDDPLLVERPRPGRALGLAWHADMMVTAMIEALVMPGWGNLILTGAASAIQDQALVARSWVRAHAALLGLGEPDFARMDIHLHVRGDVPDSPIPALGLACVAALVSALSGRAVLNGIGLSGELSLLGDLLPTEHADALAHAAADATMLIHGPAPLNPHDRSHRLLFAQVEDALAAALSSPLE